MSEMFDAEYLRSLPPLQEKWAELDRAWIEEMRQKEQERLAALTSEERVTEQLVRLSKLAMALTSGLVELIELVEGETL